MGARGVAGMDRLGEMIGIRCHLSLWRVQLPWLLRALEWQVLVPRVKTRVVFEQHVMADGVWLDCAVRRR